jgi:ABC-type phosphate transport system substrate-binding protein
MVAAGPRRRCFDVMRNRCAALVVALSFAGLRPAAAQEPYKVIVNVKVPGYSIPKETLSQIYLGHVERWGDGRPISAVDLSATSGVRASFSQAVLRMPVISVRAHWLQEMMTAGRRPPLARSTDDEVIAFVSARAGGIGYVSTATALPPTVKAVAVQ